MKINFKELLIILICLLSTSISSYAQENTLSLKVNKENIELDDEIFVNIIGRNLENIAGANIQINYDDRKMELMTKKIALEEEDIINLQKSDRILKNSEKFKDVEGMSKIIFGLKKNKILLNEKEKVLATCTFKAIDVGEASIYLEPKSQLIQEKNSNETLDYVFTNPKLQGKDTKIHIINKGRISGNISTSDGFNIENTKIKIVKDSIELKSIELKNNTYEFKNIEDGKYEVIVEKVGYETFKKDIDILGGQNLVLDFELQRIKEDLDRNGSIELEDLVFVASRFGLKKDEAKWNDDADINKDNVIDMRDVLFISRALE